MPDTAAVFRQARKAPAEFEWAVRRLAPFRASAASSGECDEHVGRFCLTFDSGHDSLPSEPARLRARRERSIAALEAAATLAPGRKEFVFPLLRYLIQAGRPADAVSHARSHARATSERADGHMVLGFALHHSGQTGEAIRELEAWLALLPEREQKKIRSLEWLVGPRAYQRSNQLDQPARERLAALAWTFADPLFMTPGNELWADHLARFAATRLLRQMQTVPLSSWGPDVEQLTIRFGEPVRITRSWRAGNIGSDHSYVEHWDPSQRTYFPPDLEGSFAQEAQLDTVWPLEKVVSRTGHSPPTIRTMRVLEHQVFVGDQVRITGVVPTDSLVRNVVRGTVFLLDSALTIISRAEAEACLSCLPADSAMLTASLPVHPEARYYSAELYDSITRFAARARHPLVRPSGSLSDILLTHAADPARPLSRPVVASGDLFGIYAEIDNRLGEHRSAGIELELRSVDRGSALGRAVGWLGEKLGVASPDSPTRMGWQVELAAGVVEPIAMRLDAGPLDPGVYRLILAVENGAGGRDVVTRDFSIVSSRSSSPRP